MTGPPIVRIGLDLILDRALYPNNALRKGGKHAYDEAAAALRKDVARLVGSHLVPLDLDGPLYAREILAIRVEIYWEREWVARKGQDGPVRRFRVKPDTQNVISALKPLPDGLQDARLVANDRQIQGWDVKQHHNPDRQGSLDIILRVVDIPGLICPKCRGPWIPTWALDECLGLWCGICRRLSVYPQEGSR